MSRGIALPALVGVLAFAGFLFGQASSAPGTITGTVEYRRSPAIPLDAVIAVRLEDVSVADPSSRVLDERILSVSGQDAPVPFQLSYDPAGINPAHSYQVRAAITANGKVLFASSANYPVITRGAPVSVAIKLQELGASAPVAPLVITLQDVRWKLIKLGGEPAVPGLGGADAHLVLHKEPARFAGSTGCNDIGGNYVLSPGGLQFFPTDTTGNKCPPDLTKQEQALFNAMKATRTYRISGDTLELRLGDELLATFRAERKK